MTTFHKSWQTFTAGEAEKITGISTATQRDWRRHGYLEAEGEGWTQYDLTDLGKLMVMRALQERGIGPSVSKDIAEVAALRLSYFALCGVEAIQDNTSGEFESMVREGKRTRGAHFVGWTNSTGDPSKYLVVWADGTIVLYNDIGAAFQEVSSEPKYHGAIIVLDLEALATLIVTRAGRPFVSVDIVR